MKYERRAAAPWRMKVLSSPLPHTFLPPLQEQARHSNYRKRISCHPGQYKWGPPLAGETRDQEVGRGWRYGLKGEGGKPHLAKGGGEEKNSNWGAWHVFEWGESLPPEGQRRDPPRYHPYSKLRWDGGV